MSKLFCSAKHAKLYATFRPRYPESVYCKIINYCKQDCEQFDFSNAVDVGCGSGQSTKPLTKWFASVTGVDPSESQIKQAAANVNNQDIKFICGKGEQLEFLENNSVDLITVAQALHWIDRDIFYKELDRVLKPNGLFVAYGYGSCELDIEAAQEQVWHFYTNTLKGFWSDGRHHIDDKYAQLNAPFSKWERDDTLFIEESQPVEHFVGYLSSWSSWQAYSKTHTTLTIQDVIGERLKGIYKDKNKDHLICRWPVFILFSRK